MHHMRFPRRVSSSRIDLVPDVEGATCGSCLTLNPPGAPACIRCTRPFPAHGVGPPAGTSANRIGSGLAAPPRGAPGG
jgi:hypothetical protein